MISLERAFPKAILISIAPCALVVGLLWAGEPASWLYGCAFVLLLSLFVGAVVETTSTTLDANLRARRSFLSSAVAFLFLGLPLALCMHTGRSGIFGYLQDLAALLCLCGCADAIFSRRWSRSNGDDHGH